MAYKYLLFSVFLLIFSSCKRDLTKNTGEIHPDYLLALDNEAYLIEVNNDNLLKWGEYYSFNISNELEIDISRSDYTIQRLTDVLITNQDILILDGGRNKIHNIDFSGNVHKPIAVGGRGPGELSEPVNFMRVSDGFMVADRVNGIHHFNTDNELVNTSTIDLMPDGICNLGNYFIKSSYVVLDEGPEDYLIFELNEEGDIVNKFSNRYKHESNMLVYNMSDGPITCVKSREIVINSYNFTIPFIEIHYPNENKSESYYFSDIRPAKVEYLNNALSFSDLNLGTKYHTFSNHSVLNDRFVIVQFNEVNRPRDSDLPYNSKLISYIIDLDKNMFFYTYTFPKILTSNEDSVLFKDGGDDYKLIFARFEIN